MTDKLMTQKEAARVLDVAPRTLREWIAAGKGPPAVKTPRRARYRHADLLAWLADRNRPKSQIVSVDGGNLSKAERSMLTELIDKCPQQKWEVGDSLVMMTDFGQEIDLRDFPEARAFLEAAVRELDEQGEIKSRSEGQS